MPRTPGDRLAVHRDENVALQKPGRMRRAGRVDRHHHGGAAARFAVAGGEGDRLQGDAEIAARDMTLVLDRLDDPQNRRGRDREHAAARAMDRHADQFAVGGDERAAFGGHCEVEIETQLGVDLSAMGTVPCAAGERDDAERGDDVALRSPDRDRKMAGPQIGCDRRGDRRRFAAETQHCDVGRGVASRKGRFDAPPVGERHREIGVALHGLLRGDNQARLPDDPARGEPAAAVDGNHCAGCRFDGRCEMS